MYPTLKCTHLISVDGKESFMIEAIPDDDSIIYGRDLGVWIQNKSFTSLLEDSFLMKFNRAKQYNFPPLSGE